MKKLLSLGLILGLCMSLVGCSNGKMSDSEIQDCIDIENTLEEYFEESMEIKEDILGESYELITKKLTQDQVDSTFNSIREYKVKLNELTKELYDIDLNKLEVYYNYLVEYSGTTQEHQDIEFLKSKLYYESILRNICYSLEMISTYEDGSFNSEDLDYVQHLYGLSFVYANTDSYELTPKETEISNEVDSKYDISTKDIHDIAIRIYKYETKINEELNN